MKLSDNWEFSNAVRNAEIKKTRNLMEQEILGIDRTASDITVKQHKKETVIGSANHYASHWKKPAHAGKEVVQQELGQAPTIKK